MLVAMTTTAPLPAPAAPSVPVPTPTPTPAETPRPARAGTLGVVAVTLALALVGGFVIGVGTQALQGELPGSWNVLANSGLMWALAAMVLGWLASGVRSAAIAGAAGLVVASQTYYLAVEWFEHTASTPRAPTIWSLAGIAAGATFGVAGQLVRRHPQWRCSAVAAIAAVSMIEGVYVLAFIPRLRPAGVVELALGAAVALACLESDRRPQRVATVLAGAATLAVCGGLGLEVAFRYF